MSFVSAFGVDDSNSGNTMWFQVINSDVVFEKQADNFGVPRGNTRCSRIVLVLRSNREADNDSMLVEWMSSPDMRKTCYLAVGQANSEVRRTNNMGSQSMRFNDTYCLQFRVCFTSEEHDESDRAVSRLRANSSYDAYTIELHLSSMSVLIGDAYSVNAPVYTVSNEGGGSSSSSSGSSGSESSSSGGEVSSFRAD